jgi:integrase
VSYDHAYKQLQRGLELAGLPPDYTFHDLRRTMAEKAYAVTHDLRVVQSLLGHDALYSTAYYLQRPLNTNLSRLSEAQEEITCQSPNETNSGEPSPMK